MSTSGSAATDTVMPKGQQILVALQPGKGEAGQEVRVNLPPESGGFVTVKMPNGIKPGGRFYVRDNAAFLTPAEDKEENDPCGELAAGRQQNAAAAGGWQRNATAAGGWRRNATAGQRGAHEGNQVEVDWVERISMDDGSGRDRSSSPGLVQFERLGHGSGSGPFMLDNEGDDEAGEIDGSNLFGCGIVCSPLFEAGGGCGCDCRPVEAAEKEDNVMRNDLFEWVSTTSLLERLERQHQRRATSAARRSLAPGERGGFRDDDDFDDASDDNNFGDAGNGDEGDGGNSDFGDASDGDDGDGGDGDGEAAAQAARLEAEAKAHTEAEAAVEAAHVVADAKTRAEA